MDRNALIDRGIIAEGYICEIRKEEDLDSATLKTIIKYVPYMSYKDKYGSEHKYRITTTSSFAPYNLHDKFKLVYDPEGEREPLVMTRLGLWGDVIGFAACGLFLILWILWSSHGIWW